MYAHRYARVFIRFIVFLCVFVWNVPYNLFNIKRKYYYHHCQHTHIHTHTHTYIYIYMTNTNIKIYNIKINIQNKYAKFPISRWGRIGEGGLEDAYAMGQYAISWAKGFQSPRKSKLKGDNRTLYQGIMTAKHMMANTLDNTFPHSR